MNNFFSRFSLLHRYMISYIIVLFIPIFILSVIIYNSFMGILKNEMTETTKVIVTQVRDSIDAQIDELHKIVINISQNDQIISPKILTSVTAAQDAIQLIKSYNFTNKFTEEILLYYKGSNFLYSSSGTYTPYTFVNYIYRYKLWDMDGFVNTITGSIHPDFRKSEEIQLWNFEKKRLITYVYPVFMNNSYANSLIIIFLIREDILSKELGNIINKYDGNVMILNDNGETITSLQDKEDIKDDEFKKLVRLEDGYPTRITIRGKKYFVCSKKSNVVNWSYITIIPAEKVMGNVLRLKNKMLFSMVSIFLLGGIVIYIFTYANYVPIKNMKSYIENNFKKFVHYETSNEIESIRETIIELGKRAEILEKDVNKDIVKGLLLINLIEGRFKNIDEFNKAAKDFNLFFSKPYFGVVVFSIRGEEIKQTENEILNITEKLPTYIEGFAYKNVNKSEFIAVVATDYKDEKIVYNWFKEFYSKLKVDKHVQITIGLGNLYRGISYVGKSFIEAFSALDYRLIKGRDTLISFNEISNYAYNIEDYPYSEIEKLEMALIKGEEEEVAEILMSLMSYIKNGVSLFIAKCVCFDIINTFIKNLHRLNDCRWQLPYITTLMKFETVDELISLIKKLILRVHEILEQNTKDKRYVLKIKTYINKNYYKYDFSLQTMADYFQMMPSNLSKYFKEQTGYTISNYVKQLKINKAKELLEKTDYDLKNIVFEIGYTNVSSFIRNFKQITGITPGNYRKLYRQRTNETSSLYNTKTDSE